MLQICGAAYSYFLHLRPGAADQHVGQRKKPRMKATNGYYIDVTIRSALWINRLRLFCLWQKAKGCGSTHKRYRVDGISLFHFEYLYYDPLRHCFNSITLFYQSLITGRSL